MKDILIFGFIVASIVLSVLVIKRNLKR